MGNEVSKWNFHTSLVFQRRTNKLSPTPQKNFSTCVHAVQCHSSSIPIELCCAMAIDRFLKITTLRGVLTPHPHPLQHIPSPFSMGCHFTLINSTLSILFVVENIKLGMFRNVLRNPIQWPRNSFWYSKRKQ